MAKIETTIPGYNIESLLGKGGMASVFKAKQQSFGREVALKVYISLAEASEAEDDGSEEGFGQRFMQESQIIAKLHHSHIVQVYDVGLHDGHYYISMEYLHGGNLAKKLALGITLAETVTLIKQAASALDFAHRKRIVHRDIKPENMMFREDGAMVLTDFGIAKELESQSNLTQTGLVIGTPKYMSPEQIRGDDVDHRTDIYALGIVFFRCLTNYLPFDGKDIVVTSFLQHNEPVPRLPEEVACFQPIINCMLEKMPEQRFQQAGEIVRALEHISAGAYDPNLTNLDIATASRHAPPTVTRSLSGTFNTTEPLAAHDGSYPGAARSDVTQLKSKPSLPGARQAKKTRSLGGLKRSEQRRKLTDYDTLEMNESRPQPAHFIMEWKDPLRQKERQTHWGAWLMSLALLGAAALVASQIWGDRISEYWDGTVVAWFDQQQTTTSTNNTTALTESEPSVQETPEQEDLAEQNDPELALETRDEPQLQEPAQDTSLEPSISSTENDTGPSDALDSALGGTEDGTEPSETALEQTEPAEPEQPSEEELARQLQETVDELLSSADADLASWRLTRPKESNAYDKYQQVLELQPENELAQAGIENIVQAYLELSDRAISEQDFETAERYINSARSIDADSAEVRRYQGRLNLALEAYQEAQLLEQAMREAELIDQLLRDAAEDEQAGRIRSPAGNNALEKYQRVLALDPENTLAIEKLVDFGR